jgi:hypothetical protein
MTCNIWVWSKHPSLVGFYGHSFATGCFHLLNPFRSSKLPPPWSPPPTPPDHEFESPLSQLSIWRLKPSSPFNYCYYSHFSNKSPGFSLPTPFFLGFSPKKIRKKRKKKTIYDLIHISDATLLWKSFCRKQIRIDRRFKRSRTACHLHSRIKR